MAEFNIIGYDNQILGQVEAVEAVEAWSKAEKQFDNILDVRQVEEEFEVVTWVERPFEWESRTGERVLLSGKMWTKRSWFSEYDNLVAVASLVPEMIEDLRDGLEPEEYSGVIEPGNIVVMVGDADGYHYIKVFPSFDTAFAEAGKLMSKFSTYDEMEESGYFDRNNYLALPRGGA